jgi:hypothetical protein
MKKKLLTAALLLSATVLLTANGFGVCSDNVLFLGVGSSAQTNSFAYAAAARIGVVDPGHFHFWSHGSGSLTYVNDTRPSTANHDNALAWIAYDDSSPRNIWAYYQVDSVVGNRAFFAVNSTEGPGATAFADPTLTSTAGTNVIPGQPDTESPDFVPSDVQACLNGASFNVALTDIRAEDALFATTRALSAYSTNLNGLGYNTACGGTANVGCPMESAFSSSTANPLKYALFGKTDPITAQKRFVTEGTSSVAATYFTLPTGVAPIVVAVSNADAATNGFGSVDGSGKYVFDNINRQVLASIYQGTLSRTTDLLDTSASKPGANVGIQVIKREPLSGTYNTFEFSAIRTFTGNNNTRGQEFGNDPDVNNFQNNPTNCTLGAFKSPCNNPMYLATGGSGGLRLSVVGSGEEIKAVAGVVTVNGNASNTKDALGYAFWSYGNLAALGTAKGVGGGGPYPGHYLTVDGIDPLFNSEGDGTNLNGSNNIPTCTNSSGVFVLPCTQQVPFTHIKDGSYPIWSLLRAVTFSVKAVSGTKDLCPTGVPVGAFCALYPEVQNMVTQAQISANDTTVRNLSDFVPYVDASGNLNVWVLRSHYTQSGTTGVNGIGFCTSFAPLTCPTTPTTQVEAGGDMGGSIISVQSDVDAVTDTGKGLISLRQ